MFNIMDGEDCKSLASLVFEDLGIADKKPSDLLNRIADYKSKNDYVPTMLLLNGSVTSKDPVIRYLEYQKKYYSLDFDDLLYYTDYILRTNKESLDKWSRFKYILLDEAHDCNPTDWSILSKMAEKNGNLTALNDIDQNIYAFRGSTVDTILNAGFEKQHILDQNYRSKKSILDVANDVIRNNKKRVDKIMFTENGQGEKPIIYRSNDDNGESKYLVSEIREALKRGVPPCEIAVLYRVSFLSRGIEQELIRNGIRYVIWGGIRFYDRKEIKDILAYLKVIVNSDDMSFRRIVNTPSRKFGSVSLQKLMTLSDKEQKPLFETLKSHLKDKEFKKEPLIKFVKLIEDCRKGSMTISETASRILMDTGLRNEYENDKEKERLDNIVELISSMKNYEEANKNEEDVSLGKYLQDISLFTNMDRKETEDAVKLMTIHQSKGLEFDTVFIYGANEGILPSQRTINERGLDGLEEERRLFYVAITRAKNNLTILYSEGYNYMAKENNKPSQFISEIAKEHIVNKEDKGKPSKSPYSPPPRKPWGKPKINWKY